MRVLFRRDLRPLLASTPAIKIPGCGPGSMASKQFAAWGASSVLDLQRVNAAELRKRLGEQLGGKVKLPERAPSKVRICDTTTSTLIITYRIVREPDIMEPWSCRSSVFWPQPLERWFLASVLHPHCRCMCCEVLVHIRHVCSRGWYLFTSWKPCLCSISRNEDASKMICAGVAVALGPSSIVTGDSPFHTIQLLSCLFYQRCYCRCTIDVGASTTTRLSLTRYRAGFHRSCLLSHS